MTRLKCWKKNKWSKQVSGNMMMEAHTNSKIPIRKSKVVSVWKDWNGDFNTYSSKYPYEYDSKIYQGKNRNLALKKAKIYMKKHDKC